MNYGQKNAPWVKYPTVKEVRGLEEVIARIMRGRGMVVECSV